MSSTLPMIRLRNLAHSRRGLRDVSLDVSAGEVVGLLGDGSGAALLILAGLLRADRGDCVVDGRLLRRTPAHRRGLGVVFAGDNLLPHLRVADHLALPLRGMRQADRRVRLAGLLDMFDLEAVASRRPAALSILQYRQAALARALVFGPRVLLLQDPFAGLDPRPRMALRAQLLEIIRANGTTVLLAGTDWQDALAMSDRIGVLADGAVAQFGAPKDLYDRPATAAVAGALGETNRLDGVLRDIEDDVALVALNCGPLVEAMPGEALAVGQRCTVHVRPERIAVSAAQAEDLGPDVISAQLRAATYLGDHVRLSVSIGTADLVVHRPAGAAAAGLRPGRPVAIAWQAAHAIVFASTHR